MEPAHRPWPHSRRLQGLHARPLVLHPGQSWWRGPAFARRASFFRCEDSTTTTLKRFLALYRVSCYFCNFPSHKCLLGVGRRGPMTGDLGDKQLLVLDASRHRITPRLTPARKGDLGPLASAQERARPPAPQQWHRARLIAPPLHAWPPRRLRLVRAAGAAY